MPNFSDIRKGLVNMESLERALHLKQLQINQLLNITQAINNNVSAEGLFQMYRSFLSWEIGIKKMMLYVIKDDKWHCASSIGIEAALLSIDIKDFLTQYTRLNNLEGIDHPLIKQFDIVIPVRHKEHAIAYVFIGGFEEEEDMYSKIQFITTITNIIAVAIENKRLFKQQLEQERMKREMELATEMQRLLIPNHLPTKKAYEFASIYRPHYGVGGDYFDFLEAEDERIIFCVGDIAGKGIAAALLMANFQANFRTLAERKNPLDKFVEELNQSIHRITKGDRFITFFIADYDPKQKILNYVNAGHNPPIMVRDGQIMQLKTGCTILGSFEQLPFIDVGTIKIQKEALILIYTDGLTDIQNQENEYLSEDIIQLFTRQNYQLSAQDFSDKLHKLAEQFKEDRTYPDDFTVLTCKLFCPKANMTKVE